MYVHNGILRNERALDTLESVEFGNRNFDSGFATSIMQHGANDRSKRFVHDVDGATTKLASNSMLAGRIKRKGA